MMQMMSTRSVWRDHAGAFRRCRETLQHHYPGLSARVVAQAVGRDAAWLSRIESGRVGPSVPNVALLAGAYFGLLRYTEPSHVLTIHIFMPDLPRPEQGLPDSQLCTAAFCWHLHELRQELGRVRGLTASAPVKMLTTGAQLHNEILAAIELQKTAGSMQTLRVVYRYLAEQIGRPLHLDEVLTIPATAHLTTPSVLARIATRREPTR